MTDNQPAVHTDKSVPKIKFTAGADGQLEINEELFEQLLEIFGAKDLETLTDYFLPQLLNLWGASSAKHDPSSIINRIIPLMRAIGPKDELEGMLACQMLGTHHLAMKMMARAMHPGQTDDMVNSNVNRATKLQRTFIAHMEALNRHRGKGKQSITVRHVTVNDGGQAIVGSVSQSGGGGGK